MPFFWAIYFQIFSLWVSMASQMDNVVFGFSIPPATITSLNPLIVRFSFPRTPALHSPSNVLLQDLFLIPFFSYAVYPLFEKANVPFPLFPLIYKDTPLSDPLSITATNHPAPTNVHGPCFHCNCPCCCRCSSICSKLLFLVHFLAGLHFFSLFFSLFY